MGCGSSTEALEAQGMRMYDSRRDGPVRPEDLLVRQADGTYRPLVPKPAHERCFKSAAIPKGPRQTSNIRQGMINVLPKLGTASWNVTGAALDSIDEKSADLFPTFKALRSEAMSKDEFIESITGHFDKELSLATRAVMYGLNSNHFKSFWSDSDVPFWAKFLAASKSDDEMAKLVTGALTPTFKALVAAFYGFIDLDHDGFVTDDDLRIPFGWLTCCLALREDIPMTGVIDKIDPYGNHALWTVHSAWIRDVGRIMRPRTDAVELIPGIFRFAATVDENEEPDPGKVIFAALDMDNSGTLDAQEIKGVALGLWSVCMQAAEHIFTRVRETFVPSLLTTEALAMGTPSCSGKELEAKIYGPLAGGVAVSAEELLTSYRAYQTVFHSSEQRETVLGANAEFAEGHLPFAGTSTAVGIPWMSGPGPGLLVFIHDVTTHEQKMAHSEAAAAFLQGFASNPLGAALLKFQETFGAMISVGGFLSISRERFGETLKPLLLKAIDFAFDSIATSFLDEGAAESAGDATIRWFWYSVLLDANRLIAKDGPVLEALIDLTFSFFDAANEGCFKARQITNFLTLTKPVGVSPKERLGALLAFLDRDGDGKVDAADVNAFNDKLADKLFSVVAALKVETDSLVESVIERLFDKPWSEICKLAGSPSTVHEGMDTAAFSKLLRMGPLAFFIALQSYLKAYAETDEAGAGGGAAEVPKWCCDLAAELFRRIDQNGDGRITRAELIKTVRTDEEVRKVLGLPVKIGEEQRGDLEAVFQDMDRDDSRGVDLAEFTAFIQRKFPGGYLGSDESKTGGRAECVGKGQTVGPAA